MAFRKHECLNSNLDTSIGNSAPAPASVCKLVPCGNCGMDVSLVSFNQHRAACNRNVEGEDGRVTKKGMKEVLHD